MKRILESGRFSNYMNQTRLDSATTEISKSYYNYLRDYEMFTALVERVSEGIFGFSSEEAYQRELNKEKHPSKKRKKFGRR